MWVCPCVQTVTVDFINVYHAKRNSTLFLCFGAPGQTWNWLFSSISEEITNRFHFTPPSSWNLNWIQNCFNFSSIFSNIVLSQYEITASCWFPSFRHSLEKLFQRTHLFVWFQNDRIKGKNGKFKIHQLIPDKKQQSKSKLSMGTLGPKLLRNN